MGRRGDAGNLLWCEVETVLVIAHGRAAPKDERWRELVLDASEPLPGGGRRPRPWSAVLIYSLGGMPTVTQRAALGSMLTVTGDAPPVALVSESPLARGVLTAVRWIVPKLHSVRAFPPEQRSAALQALGIPAGRQREVERALEEMLSALAKRVV